MRDEYLERRIKAVRWWREMMLLVDGFDEATFARWCKACNCFSDQDGLRTWEDHTDYITDLIDALYLEREQLDQNNTQPTPQGPQETHDRNSA